MKKLIAKDFTIKSEIIRYPIHEDQCWYYIYYNGSNLHRCPTKTDARRYISELVKYANFFLVEHTEAYSELLEKVSEAKNHFGGKLNGDNVPSVVKEAARVVELLEPLERVLSRQDKLAEKKKENVERD